MYQSETMDAVRDAAQILTREGKVLTIGNPEFPLAVFADTYKVDDVPTNSELPNEEMVAVEDHFDEINQESTPSEDDARTSISTNLAAAVAKVQFNTTNVIIPAISAMHQFYAGMQSAASQPEYQVKGWRYLAPHNNPVLVNHVNTRYTNVPPKDAYKSFNLENVSAEAIIEMMAVNNPHMEQEEITEWALQVGAERIEAVWNSLFSSGGHVIPTGLPYLAAQNAPFNVDEILAAYFICGHYIDNPVVVPNVSVDLDDWEHSMKLLHEMFGFYLGRAYARRADWREQGVMILKNEAINPIATRRAVVVVNGDVFDPWVVGGGDIQAILGAAVENTGVTDVKYIDAGAQRFVQRWHDIYPLIQQAAIDYSDRQRINNVITAFREVGRQEPLKALYTAETEQRLTESLRYIRRDDYDNPYKVFSTLVCRVYFPESTYLEYLDEIDQHGITYPKADIRELATQATLSLVAMFLAKQIKVESFIPEIDIEGTSGGPINDSGLLAIADTETEDEISVDETEVGVDETTLDVDSDVTETDDVQVDSDVVPEDVASETEVEEDFGDVADEEEDPYADIEAADAGEETEDDIEEVVDTDVEDVVETEDVSETEESDETESEETTVDEDEEDETPLT